MNGVRARTLAAVGLLAATGSGAATTAATDESAAPCCAIVELRQYTLHPGRFDGFVRLFEDEFLDPLEAAGMTVIGQFRDLDDPDRFVWLRGFADMPARAASLAAFYDGPVWKARREAANANFTDTENVLLLHPVVPGAGIRLVAHERAAHGTRAAGHGLIVATVYSLTAADEAGFPVFFAHEVRPALAQAGIEPLATFATEHSANNFPRLPVREGEHAFVWLVTFADRASGDAALARLERSARWRELAPRLRRHFQSAPQVLRLAPTPRSRLPG